MQNYIHSRKEIKTFGTKIREDVVDGPSIVFTRKAVVEAWLYITKLGLHLPAQIYRCKVLSLHRGEIMIYWGKIREHVVGGPSIVFTRKAVADETFIRKSTNK